MALGTTVLKESSFAESPVWKRTITYTFADDDTTLTPHALSINGIIQRMIIKLGTATDGGATATLALTDSDGNSIFSAAALADATSYAYSISEPISDVVNVNVTPTDPGGAWTITVYLRGI